METCTEYASIMSGTRNRRRKKKRGGGREKEREGQSGRNERQENSRMTDIHNNLNANNCESPATLIPWVRTCPFSVIGLCLN